MINKGSVQPQACLLVATPRALVYLANGSRAGDTSYDAKERGVGEHNCVQESTAIAKRL